MSYTVNIKGKPNRQQKGYVKLILVLYKSGYPRAEKVLNITGLLKDWDQDSQNFSTKSPENIDKNLYLAKIKSDYRKIADEWENEGHDWCPIQWAHHFEKVNAKKNEIKILSVLQMIDNIIETKKNSQRFKNGEIVSCETTGKTYKDVRNTLIKFTKEKYNQNFSSYFFEDISEQFLTDYIFYLRKIGAKKGNKGRVPGRLKTFCGVFYYANKKGIPHTDISLFDNFRLYMKEDERMPQTIPLELMEKIENHDRSTLTEEEIFHLDMFLFCFYAGGIAPIDMAYLTWDSIKNGILRYERFKVCKSATMPFLNSANAIARKYRKQCFNNHVLPLVGSKDETHLQKAGKIGRISHELNKTMKKIALEYGYTDKIVWYSARGTFITKMMRLGYEAPDIAVMCGNSAATIYKNYFKPKDPKSIKNDLNKLFQLSGNFKVK